MTDARFAAALAVVLRGRLRPPSARPGRALTSHGGGGGAAPWPAARGRPVSVAEVRALTRVEAGAIYRRLYWATVKAEGLPAGLDLAVFDLAVNSGPGRAARLLQRALGLLEDGVIGPKTLDAVASRDPAATVRALTRERLGFLGRLPTWKTFGRGWRRRVEDVEAEALRLAAAARPADPAKPMPPAVLPTASPPTPTRKDTHVRHQSPSSRAAPSGRTSSALRQSSPGFSATTPPRSTGAVADAVTRSSSRPPSSPRRCFASPPRSCSS